ncbi:hypothetical protein POM88_036993 [Heracleum sosnowskyi]|uniref:Uncharacterized protein n=1 Tax=Heracleum sosnowskyi TaxID=360622 RepID=A0AAD8HQC8_9APIA|nr:hypothetical protein POM88_036993 [Heracleum sosnowskyi]
MTLKVSNVLCNKLIKFHNAHTAGDESYDRPYQSLQLQGYILGKPLVSPQRAINSQFTFAHRMGLISDEYYESAKENCNAEFFDLDPNNVLCRDAIELMKECLPRLDIQHILDVNCGLDQPESDEIQSDYLITGDNLFPSWNDKLWCRVFCFSFILIMEGTQVNMHCISFSRNFDLVPE